MKSAKSRVAAESDRRGVYADVKEIPDTLLLPSQFFEFVGARTLSSEQRLMLAVLADAINVLRGYKTLPHRDKHKSLNEALSWVFANGITSSLSFDYVCDALDLNTESLRRRLSESVSEHGANLRKLRHKSHGRRPGPKINRIRRK
jgi:hypothetical protein